MREVDDAHSPAPQLTLNDVAADALSDAVARRGSRRGRSAERRPGPGARQPEIESMRLEQRGDPRTQLRIAAGTVQIRLALCWLVPQRGRVELPDQACVTVCHASAAVNAIAGQAFAIVWPSAMSVTSPEPAALAFLRRF